ncbi:MAG: DUF1461 domain-containing protein [Candidatus Aenigmarchaeota archaeon]|nr:DUF1461 domain-containing protein [Candidatus Aenigmarchaeota archaeon]
MRSAFSKAVIFLMIVKGIFVISLILSLFLWSIPILSFNSEIWDLFQKRSGVLVSEDVKSYNDLVIEFFRTGLGLGFLNEREFSHMEDVKQVITIVNILVVFSFVSLVSGVSYLSRSQKKFLLDAARKTSLAVFLMTLILSVLILLNFNVAFLSFHKIFFVRNFIFPADSLLKTLYPDQFFRDLAAVYLLSIMVISLVVAAVTHRLKLK